VFLVIGKHNIDQPKMNVQLTTTELSELDSSDSCTACEAFITVFEDRLANDSVSVDDIDLIELCNEVEVVHKNQVNKAIFVFLNIAVSKLCEIIITECVVN